MAFWFSETFAWQQINLGQAVVNAGGVCTVLVSAWLKLKQTDTTHAGLRTWLGRMQGSDWAGIKAGVLDGGIGNDWRNLAIEQFGVAHNDMATLTLNDDGFGSGRQFLSVGSQASLYRFNYVHLGPLVGRSHAVGVFRDTCTFRKYHMFDPNFGECRATYRTGVQEWLAWLYRKQTPQGGRKYATLDTVNVRSWN